MLQGERESGADYGRGGDDLRWRLCLGTALWCAERARRKSNGRLNLMLGGDHPLPRDYLLCSVVKQIFRASSLISLCFCPICSGILLLHHESEDNSPGAKELQAACRKLLYSTVHTYIPFSSCQGSKSSQGEGGELARYSSQRICPLFQSAFCKFIF